MIHLRSGQKLLGQPSPVYAHHGLIRDDAMAKLSKSKRSQSLHDLRAQGMSPAAIKSGLEF